MYILCFLALNNCLFDFLMSKIVNKHLSLVILGVDAPMCTMVDMDMFSMMEFFFDDSCL